MPQISACIISLDEEDKLEDCLKSLDGVVDEIVLVDSGSKDRTLEIAKRYTERVIHQDWLGMGAQKAFAYSQAKHDWILNLDCDERLTPELAQEIRKVAADPGAHRAYEFTRKTHYIYRWLDHCWYPEWRTRLFDRRVCVVRGTDPHEYVHLEEGTTGRISGDLLHYSFDTVSDHLRTLDSYTTIAAERLIEEGRTVRVWSPLTRGAWTLFRVYFLKGAWRDGFAGLTAAVLSGLHSFLKYAKVIFARRTQAGSRTSTSVTSSSQRRR